MNFLKTEKPVISVERACTDLRKGYPVIINNNNRQIIAISAEEADEALISYFRNNLTNAKILITANRAKTVIKNYSNDQPLALNLSDINNVRALCGLENKDINYSIDITSNIKTLEISSLELAKIAELMPCTIIAEYTEQSDNLLSVTEEDIINYATNISQSLHEICSTNLKLKNASDSKILAFRPTTGGREHYAIIIGNPDLNCPIIRVHSSCYTGDLLASLTCDCRDQLQDAIETMAKAEGGIIIYLLQEGRGIGLVNKLRAYNLKEQGLDTVQANENLGFDDDARIFQPAVQILKQMNIKQVQLMTNNPKKAQGLEELGIIVTKTVPSITQTNIHNEDYLNTKISKMGHTIPGGES